MTGNVTWPIVAFCFSLLMALQTPGQLTRAQGSLIAVGRQAQAGSAISLRMGWGGDGGVQAGLSQQRSSSAIVIYR